MTIEINERYWTDNRYFYIDWFYHKALIGIFEGFETLNGNEFAIIKNDDGRYAVSPKILLKKIRQGLSLGMVSIGDKVKIKRRLEDKTFPSRLCIITIYAFDIYLIKSDKQKKLSL